MKKHLSKRLLSLFLAVVMVVTCAPFVAFATTEGRGGNSHYLFAYFTGDSDESVRLAVSDDGLNFEALNGNLPVLEGYPSEIYTVNDVEGIAASGKVRDPYILPKQDAAAFISSELILKLMAQQITETQNFLSGTCLQIHLIR